MTDVSKKTHFLKQKSAIVYLTIGGNDKTTHSEHDANLATELNMISILRFSHLT